MEKLTEEDYERFDRLSLQLKYEAKYKRLHLMEEMYRLAKEALMAIRYAVDQGEGGSDLAVPAAQFRLLIKDYMNQTREEHGEAPIFSQQQVNIVQRVIIRAPEGVNAKVVDGEVVD